MTDDSTPVVLGLELATAAAADAAVHRQNPGLTSPLGAGYDVDGGETDLVRFRDSAADGQIAALVERVHKSPAAEQTQARTALTISDFYTLLSYAGRSAVRAIRDTDAAAAMSGLAAIALVDDDRVDWRDAVRATALGFYALDRVSGDRAEGIRLMRTLPHPELADQLDQIEQSESAPELNDWGYAEVTTKYGLGMAERGLDRFNPTMDVAGLAVAVADLLERDIYRASSITLGAKMPAIWFPEIERQGVEKIMKKAPATASIEAVVRPGESADGESQQLTVFLAQTKDADSAAFLADWSNNNPDGPHAFVCASSDRLFALIIARSFVQGVPDLETTEALQRFGEPLALALAAALGSA